jgi:SAM-dependent methyltransferase
MPVLVTALRFRNRFMPGYASRLARTYESHRDNIRWRKEAEAFERLYALVRPATVLDCPVGTGRWLPVFQRNGAAVVGMDLSEHMLAVARKRVGPGADVRLVEGDALDPALLRSLDQRFDLIVCTRFAHWLPPKALSGLIGSFAASGSRFLLLGAKVSPEGPPRRHAAPSWRRIGKRIKARLHRNIVNHVHEEDVLLGIAREHGWSLVTKELVLENADSRYFFYLCSAAPMRQGRSAA